MTANPLLNGKPVFEKLTPQQAADEGNARLLAMGRRDCHWVVRDGQTKMEMTDYPVIARKSLMDRRGEPMSEVDTIKLNGILADLGATARYRADGSRYFIDREE